MPDPYTQLLEWRRGETAARGLSKLPHDFYPNTNQYLSEVRRSYETELRENPSGKKGDLSRQTYQRASQIARDIVEARMTKLLSAAFQATVGGTRELPNSLAEERSLFDDLLRVLREHRKGVAPYLDPLGESASSSGSVPSSRSTPAAEASSQLPGPAPGARADESRAYVRILKTVGTMEVGDETIDLRQEDLLSLPPEKARLLIESKVAERVEVVKPSSTT